jgi:hypothetical protein
MVQILLYQYYKLNIYNEKKVLHCYNISSIIIIN